MSRAFTPPGWPSGVRPPDTPRWELTAEAWLLDHCPPEYREYPTLRRYLVVLARFAAIHVEACQEATRRGLSEARGVLGEVAPTDVVEEAVQTYLAEDARLGALRREVALVEEAIHGTRHRVKL